MMWNPPHLLLVFSPFLNLPFEVSARIFASLNILFCLLSSRLVLPVIDPDRTLPDLVRVILTIFFFPSWVCLDLGQIGLFLLFCSSLGFFAIARERWFLAALGIVGLSLKPHLFLPLGFGLLWFCLRKKNFRLIFYIAGLLISLICLSYLAFPVATEAWLESFRMKESEEVTTVYSWRTATLSSELSSFLQDSAGRIPLWPRSLIPALGLMGLSIYLLKKPRADFVKLFPGILCWGLVIAPFAWEFDASVLLITQLVSAQMFFNLRSKLQSLWIAPIMLQCLIFAHSILRAEFHHEFWYLPCLLFLLWLTASRLSQQKEG